MQQSKILETLGQNEKMRYKRCHPPALSSRIGCYLRSRVAVLPSTGRPAAGGVKAVACGVLINLSFQAVITCGTTRQHAHAVLGIRWPCPLTEQLLFCCKDRFEFIYFHTKYEV